VPDDALIDEMTKLSEPFPEKPKRMRWEHVDEPQVDGGNDGDGGVDGADTR
jgi:hypothetical protein